jgi:hypothetical protein
MDILASSETAGGYPEDARGVRLFLHAPIERTSAESHASNGAIASIIIGLSRNASGLFITEETSSLPSSPKKQGRHGPTQPKQRDTPPSLS